MNKWILLFIFTLMTNSVLAQETNTSAPDAPTPTPNDEALSNNVPPQPEVNVTTDAQAQNKAPQPVTTNPVPALAPTPDVVLQANPIEVKETPVQTVSDGVVANTEDPVVKKDSGKITIPEPLNVKNYKDQLKPIMDVPTSLDLALGSFKINKEICDLKYAYSSETVDPFENKKTKYEFFLTSKPMTAKSFSEIESLAKHEPTDQCWFYAEIESKVSVSPMKFFIPGQQIVSFADTLQPFLRKNIDVQDGLMAGTILFKEPMIIEKTQVTGQLSFRSQFRTLGKSMASILKRSQFVQKNTIEPYKVYAANFDQSKTRNIASTETASTAEAPKKINFKYGFINNKEKVAVLIVEDSSEKDTPANYGIVLMNQKSGQWVKEQEKWTTKLPAWALRN